MSVPRVSVLLPFYQAAATLAEAVADVRAQTLPDWELVAVDDGSTDGSADALRAAAGDDPRVRLLPLPHAGLVPALNAGLAACRADWVARLDADDRCAPRRLEAQLAHAASHPDQGVIGTGVELFPAERVAAGMRHYEAWQNACVTPEELDREMYVESPLVHPTVMVRREVVVAAGGYRDGDFPEDYDLWLRLHRQGIRMGKVPEVLVRWREGEGRLTRTDPRYGRDAFPRLKAHHLARGWLGGRTEVQVWGAGPDGRRFRRALAAEGIRVVRFLDIDPRKVGRVLAGGAPVVDAAEVGARRDLPLLVAVGVKGARALIRERLAAEGFRETVDYRCVQ
jgi:GT2 family glycosyltransferase